MSAQSERLYEAAEKLRHLASVRTNAPVITMEQAMEAVKAMEIGAEYIEAKDRASVNA